MKHQTSLPIQPIEVRRQCSWGTCDNDYAYCIGGDDFCFAHGAMILEERMKGSPIIVGMDPAGNDPVVLNDQLEIVK